MDVLIFRYTIGIIKDQRQIIEDTNFTKEKVKQLKERYQKKIEELEMDLTRAQTIESIAQKRYEQALKV